MICQLTVLVLTKPTPMIEYVFFGKKNATMTCLGND